MKVAAKNQVAVGFGEFVQGVIQLGSDLVPGVIILRKHIGRFLFALAAAHLGADGVRGEVLRGAMQPAEKRVVMGKIPCLFGQGEENGLRDILGKVGITNDAKRHGVNEIDVPLDQLGEGFFLPPFSI